MTTLGKTFNDALNSWEVTLFTETGCFLLRHTGSQHKDVLIQEKKFYS